MRCTLEKKLYDKQKELNSMRKMIALLTEKCQNALCQTQFKDDIIKEMRKQLKNTTNMPKVNQIYIFMVSLKHKLKPITK